MATFIYFIIKMRDFIMKKVLLAGLGDRIKNLRINNKMTLEEVGEKIGVSKQTLYKYENNIITNIIICI